MGCEQSKEPEPVITWTAKDVVDKRGVIRTTDHRALLPVTSEVIDYKDKVAAANNSALSQTKHVHELGMLSIVENPLEREVLVYHDFSAFRTHPDTESHAECAFSVEGDKSSDEENKGSSAIYDNTLILQDCELVTINLSVDDVSEDVSTIHAIGPKYIEIECAQLEFKQRKNLLEVRISVDEIINWLIDRPRQKLRMKDRMRE